MILKRTTPKCEVNIQLQVFLQELSPTNSINLHFKSLKEINFMDSLTIVQWKKYFRLFRFREERRFERKLNLNNEYTIILISDCKLHVICIY